MMRRLKTRTGRGVAIAAALAVTLAVMSGCAALPGGGPAPLDTYDLSAVSPDARGRAIRRQILVTEPVTLKALDSENIVVRPEKGAITFLAGAQWGDRLPKVVQARLIESFQRSGRITGVGRPGEGLAIDYQIITDIRAFEIQANGAERAHVAISVRLLNDRNGIVRRQRAFEAEVPVTGRGNDAYVRALDTAFRDVARDIVNWTLKLI